jgi:hypothetical protein
MASDFRAATIVSAIWGTSAVSTAAAVYPRILIFIKRDAVLAPIIKLGGAGRRMRRHLARLGTEEGVVADLRCDAGLHAARHQVV